MSSQHPWPNHSDHFWLEHLGLENIATAAVAYQILYSDAVPFLLRDRRTGEQHKIGPRWARRVCWPCQHFPHFLSRHAEKNKSGTSAFADPATISFLLSRNCAVYDKLRSGAEPRLTAPCRVPRRFATRMSRKTSCTRPRPSKPRFLRLTADVALQTASPTLRSHRLHGFSSCRDLVAWANASESPGTVPLRPKADVSWLQVYLFQGRKGRS